MTFWEIIWLICQFPLGVAAVMLSIIAGMAVFLACSFICYCLWAMLFEWNSDKYKIFGRKDEETEERETQL